MIRYSKNLTDKIIFFAKAMACENIRFSTLFAAGDVLLGGTSATQWQKFHTDDVMRNVPSSEERGEMDVFAGY